MAVYFYKYQNINAWEKFKVGTPMGFYLSPVGVLRSKWLYPPVIIQMNDKPVGENNKWEMKSVGEKNSNTSILIRLFP